MWSVSEHECNSVLTMIFSDLNCYRWETLEYILW